MGEGPWHPSVVGIGEIWNDPGTGSRWLVGEGGPLRSSRQWLVQIVTTSPVQYQAQAQQQSCLSHFTAFLSGQRTPSRLFARRPRGWRNPCKWPSVLNDESADFFAPRSLSQLCPACDSILRPHVSLLKETSAPSLALLPFFLVVAMFDLAADQEEVWVLRVAGEPDGKPSGMFPIRKVRTGFQELRRRRAGQEWTRVGETDRRTNSQSRKKSPQTQACPPGAGLRFNSNNSKSNNKGPLLRRRLCVDPWGHDLISFSVKSRREKVCLRST